MNWTSTPSPAPCRNTHRSRGTPAAVAASAEHSSSAAAWSTLLFEFINFVYGKQIRRFSLVGVAISDGEYARRIAASSLPTAIVLMRDHRRDATATCSA